MLEKKFVACAFYELRGMEVYYIVPNGSQFFIRIHVYRQTMMHVKGEKFLRHFFASLTYNFSIRSHRW